MGELLRHRGPDDEGFHVEQTVGLVHRRLSILDLAGGRQPLYSEDRDKVAVVNGEIYNYKELRDYLESRGHEFKTRTDSEVLVHGYEEWGDEVVQKIRGMFAFALWDTSRRRLLLARDRIGIKPLYYALLGGHGSQSVLFGSEIKALLVDPHLKGEIDPLALELYLALRYVPGPRTMLKDVYKLLPGQLLVYSDGEAHLRTYWDFFHLPGSDFQGPIPSEEEYVEAFRSLVKERVEDHLMADVPVGVFLSGGIDSTVVAAIMARTNKGGPVLSFSIGYPGNPDEDELAYAAQAAACIGTSHREVALDAAETVGLVDKIAWHMDEPVADPAAVPLYVLSSRARKEVAVVLSGEGADELLAGYNIYRRALRLDGLRRVGGGLFRVMGRLGASLGIPGRYQRQLDMLGVPLSGSYRGVSVAFSDQERRAMGMGHVDVADALNEYFERVCTRAPLEQMLYVDTKVWLPDDLLVKADKMTMAHSLELRVPFLDHEVVEYARCVPESLKIRQGVGKVLLRSAFGTSVPEEILTRKKKGFPVPVHAWLRDMAGLGGYAFESLLSSGSVCRDLFPLDKLREVIHRHVHGPGDMGAQLWTLLFLHSWHQTVVKGRGTQGLPV